jgi:hypothetical protein
LCGLVLFVCFFLFIIFCSPFFFRYALMQECWATQLTARPALAVVSRRLQAMHAVPSSGRPSDGRVGLMAIMNPAYEDGALADASEL